MSWFLQVLRCILCCQEQEQDWYEPDRSISFSNPPQPTYFHSTTTSPHGQWFPSSSSTSSSHPLMRDYQIHQHSGVYEKLLERQRTSRLSLTSNNPRPSLSTTLQNPISQKPPPPIPSAPKLPTISPTLHSSSSPKPPPSPNLSERKISSSKPTLSRLPSSSTNQPSKTSYLWLQKGMSSVYVIPEDIKDLIKKGIVPGVLKNPLSPSTYADYFAALLYAEDFYIEKWSKFQLENVPLDLEEAAVYEKSSKDKRLNETSKKENKTFVVLKIDSVPEKRPFLLSRDFVFVRPSGSETEPFQGTVHRVVKSTKVLVEFGKKFHSQHRSTRRYDVSFSFNRVCLTRAHKAVEAASDPLFKNFIFPRHTPRVDLTSPPSSSANHNLAWEILSLKAPAPYLVKAPLCISKEQLSKTGSMVSKALLQIYNIFPESRILICASTNKTCDLLMRSLKVAGIPESDMFRANAAFREIDGVPIDILSYCVYDRECFACPQLEGLRKMRVIAATFVSSVRLCNEGIVAGHFSHVFLVDASSATEPEAMIALANLADEKTKVVVTGAPGNAPGWVRSGIARGNGLRRSYFERLWNGTA